MKELKNDIYDDETFFLSVDPEYSKKALNEIKEWLDPENQKKIKLPGIPGVVTKSTLNIAYNRWRKKNNV